MTYRTRAVNPANPGDSLEVDIGPVGGPIVNVHLANFMWYVDAQQVGFLTDLMAAVLASDSFINPANFAQDAVLAVLLGRPLALTRAVLGMETSGGVLPLNQADNTPNDPFPQDVHQQRFNYADRQQFSSAALGGVQFPVRLGELANLDDGLVGYLIDGSGANPYGTLYSPAAPADGKNGVTHPTAQTIQLTLNALSVAVTMLIDPRASIHATTGVLPVEALAVPPDQYSQAMSSLAMTFFTTPILRKQTGLTVPLPQETGYAWSWLAVGDSPVALKANAVDENAAYGYSPQTLREGWLALEPAPRPAQR